MDSSIPPYHTTGSFDFIYLDIPLYLRNSISEQISLWVGPTLGVNLSSSCVINHAGMNCRPLNVSKVIYPVSFGVDVRLTKRLGVTAFYEFTADDSSGDLASDIRGYSATGLNLFFVF